MCVCIICIIVTRGAYCAIVAATLANVMCEEVIHHTSQWIARSSDYRITGNVCVAKFFSFKF